MGNFFNNLGDKMRAFMIGRNGYDKLAFACLIVAVVLGLINAFLSNFILSILCWALLIYAIFRCMSTNVSARQAENEKFEKLFSRGKSGSAHGGSGANGHAANRGSRGAGSGAGRAGSGYAGSSRTNSTSHSYNTSRTKKTVNDTLNFQCEQCGQKLSVPKGKGTLKVTCPKCHHQQKVQS